MVQDPEQPKPPLPDDHGQFGANNATEDYKPLPAPPPAGTPDPAHPPGTS